MARGAGVTPKPAVSRSHSASETEELGRGLSSSLGAGDILLLEGDLAAGKTTFVRGVVSGLGGAPEAVSSPTFVLLQTYDCGSGKLETVHHVDLYRLGEDVTDLREIGLEEILSERRAVVAVEWPKHTIAAWIPADARVWRSRSMRTIPEPLRSMRPFTSSGYWMFDV
jgi:tRNA threonylcarbamoyladenosine biosynthesis protein TsaE